MLRGALIAGLALGCGRVGFDSVSSDDGADFAPVDGNDAPAANAIGLAQTASTWSTAMVVTQPLTLSPAPEAKSLVVVSVSTSFQVVTSVTDNAGNTYVGVPSNPTQNSPTYCNIFVYYARDIATTPSFTTSVTVASADHVSVAIHVFTAADQSAALADDLRNSGNGSAPTCGPVQSDEAGSAYVATLCHNSDRTTTFGAGFQATEAPTESGNNNSALATAYKLGDATPTTASATLSANDDWQVILAAFH